MKLFIKIILLGVVIEKALKKLTIILLKTSDHDIYTLYEYIL